MKSVTSPTLGERQRVRRRINRGAAPGGIVPFPDEIAYPANARLQPCEKGEDPPHQQAGCFRVVRRKGAVGE